MSTGIDLPHAEFRTLLEDTDVRFQEIADAVGVSHTTVYRWKVGRSTPSKAHIREAVELIEAKQNQQALQLTRVKDGLDEYWRYR